MSFPRSFRANGVIACLVLATSIFFSASTEWTQAATGPQSVPSTRIDREFIPKQVIVQYEGSTTNHYRSVVRSYTDMELLERSRFAPGLELVEVAADETVAEKIRELESMPGVDFAEPNFIRTVARVPNDPEFTAQRLWGLHNLGEKVSTSFVDVPPLLSEARPFGPEDYFSPGFTQEFPAGRPDVDMDAPEAWNRQTGKDVLVGVVDTGIDYTHEDLAANMWGGRGWDFADRDADPDDDPSFFDGEDISGHGTHVAGTIGAVGNNGIGVAGVSWKTKLMALKVFGDTEVQGAFGTAEAYRYAGDKGARVVNASIGGEGSSNAELDAIQDSPRTLFVFAAGNERNNNDGAVPIFPCNYEPKTPRMNLGTGTVDTDPETGKVVTIDNVICVANHDQYGNLFVSGKGGSNYGAKSVDLAAPGTHILSTVPTRLGHKYEFKWGTSMASPQVAGAAALLISQAPKAPLDTIKSSILDSVDPMAWTGDRKTVTQGRLNVNAALSLLAKRSDSERPRITGYSAEMVSPTSNYVRFTLKTLDNRETVGMRFRIAGKWGPWLKIKSNGTFALPSNLTGKIALGFQVRDSAENRSDVKIATVTRKKRPDNPPVVNKPPTLNKPVVTHNPATSDKARYQIVANDDEKVTEMRIKLDGSWQPWTKYTPSGIITLPKDRFVTFTIFFQVRDGAKLESEQRAADNITRVRPVTHVTPKNYPPTISSAQVTLKNPTDQAVRFNLSASDPDNEIRNMRYLVDGVWKDWVDYTPTGTIRLPDGKYGTFTIVFQLRDAFGAVSAETPANPIVRPNPGPVDTARPVLSNATASSPANESNLVPFSLAASDNVGITQMQVRVNNGTWRDWQTYFQSGTIQVLDTLWGEVKLDFKVRDAAGNESVVQTANMVYRRANSTLVFKQVLNSGEDRDCGSEAFPCSAEFGKRFRIAFEGKVKPNPGWTLVRAFRRAPGSSTFTEFVPAGRDRFMSYRNDGASSTTLAPICGAPGADGSCVNLADGLWRFEATAGISDTTEADPTTRTQYMQVTTPDTAGPVLSNATASSPANESNLVPFSLAASDNVGITQMQVRVNNGTWRDWQTYFQSGTIQVLDTLWGEVKLDFKVRDAAGNESVLQTANVVYRRANISIRLVQLSNAGSERTGCGIQSDPCDSKSGRQLRIVISGNALPPAVALYQNGTDPKTYVINGTSTTVAPVCPSSQSCWTFVNSNFARRFQVIAGTTAYTNSAESGSQYMKINHNEAADRAVVPRTRRFGGSVAHGQRGRPPSLSSALRDQALRKLNPSVRFGSMGKGSYLGADHRILEFDGRFESFNPSMCQT